MRIAFIGFWWLWLIVVTLIAFENGHLQVDSLAFLSPLFALTYLHGTRRSTTARADYYSHLYTFQKLLANGPLTREKFKVQIQHEYGYLFGGGEQLKTIHLNSLHRAIIEGKILEKEDSFSLREEL